MDKVQGINSDLVKEQRKASIDVERVSTVLYGDLLQKKRAVGLLCIIISCILLFCLSVCLMFCLSAVICLWTFVSETNKLDWIGLDWI